MRHQGTLYTTLANGAWCCTFYYDEGGYLQFPIDTTTRAFNKVQAKARVYADMHFSERTERKSYAVAKKVNPLLRKPSHGKHHAPQKVRR